MSRTQIIRYIVERDIGNLGIAAETVQQQDTELYQAACDHFGTWDTALKYAGVSKRTASRRAENSRDNVLRQLHRVCVHGGNLSAQRMRERNRQLYEAAKQHFGTWRQALEAAGVNLKNEPLSLKPRRLDRQQIVKDLREQHAAGLSLSWSVACLENRALATAAKNAFQTWRRALIAAGLVSAETAPVPSNDRWSDHHW